jgi:ABC-2 type transport system permease protein
MISYWVWTLFKSDWRLFYGKKFYILTDLVATMVTLLIYWYSSLAFKPAMEGSVESYGSDYFTYLIIGDIFLSLPLTAVDLPVKWAQRFHVEGLLEVLLSRPVSFFKLHCSLSCQSFPRELLRTFLTLFLCIIIFDLTLPTNKVILIFIFSLLSYPLFLFLGIIFSSPVLATGRGKGLLGQFLTFSSFLAGGFFPISVLPDWLRNFSYYTSPFTYYLENIRRILGQSEFSFYSFVIVLLVWTFILWGVSFFFQRFGLSYLKKKGWPTLNRY